MKMFVRCYGQQKETSSLLMQASRILEKHTGETRLQLYFVCVYGRVAGQGQQVLGRVKLGVDIYWFNSIIEQDRR